MTTNIFIDYNSNLDKAYDSIREMLDARYHQQGNSFPEYTLSDTEIGEIESLSSYASHASDDVDYCEGDQYVNGIHIERLIY